MALIRALVVSCFASQSAAFLNAGSPLSALSSLFRSPARHVHGNGLMGLRAVAASSKPKLMYFDGRGVAEPARLLFAAAGVDYDDMRYGVDMTLKPPKAVQFEEDKKAGKFASNMGRLPILVVDGVEIAQSHSILRYIANKYGFMGESLLEAAQIDAIYEHVRDIKDNFARIRAIKAEDEKKQAMDKYYSTDLSEWCAKLDKCMGPHPGCAVGAKASMADVAIYAWLSAVDNRPAVDKALVTCPKLAAVADKVAAMPGVQAWLAKRPNTAF